MLAGALRPQGDCTAAGTGRWARSLGPSESASAESAPAPVGSRAAGGAHAAAAGFQPFQAISYGASRRHR